VDEAVGGTLAALGALRLPGGYAANAAIPIMGAAVLILCTSDAPLPSPGKSAASYFPAKRVGLINIAYNLPLVVGPPTAGVVLSLMSSPSDAARRGRRCRAGGSGDGGAGGD
jgi:hypothetical protein